MSVQERIKNSRIDAGLTQKELADKIGMSQTMVAKFELGTKIPSIDAIRDIAIALDVSTDSILGR